MYGTLRGADPIGGVESGGVVAIAAFAVDLDPDEPVHGRWRGGLPEPGRMAGGGG